MEKKKNILIGALLVAIVLMSVGYAALAQVLTINGTANITSDWDVKITKIELTDSKGATEKTAAAKTDTSATFDVDLAYPGAYAEYEVTVANEGNIDAILSSITGVDTANTAQPTQITYTVTGIAESDTLAAKNGETIATHVATVRVEWVANTDGQADTIPETKTKTATINLNYTQNT